MIESDEINSGGETEQYEAFETLAFADHGD